MPYIFLVTSCTSSYTQPDFGDFASFTIEHKSSKYPSSTRVNVYNNDMCISEEGYGRLSRVRQEYNLLSKAVTARLSTGKQIFVVFDGSMEGSYSLNQYTTFTCTNLVSFIPIKGMSYLGYQFVDAENNCRSYIVEGNTGEMVTSFKEHKTPDRCINTNISLAE